MSKRDQLDVTRVLRALAVAKRQEILQLLAERALCVGALSRFLGISAGAVSQHLRILKDAGLVVPDRRGYFIHYSLAPDAEERCRAVMESLFRMKPRSKRGGTKCVAKKRSAKGRKN